MAENNIFERELQKIVDPLQDETRRVRKGLVTWSMAAVAVTLGGLLPKQIQVLGLTVDASNQTVLLTLLACTLVYLLCSFAIYGMQDLAYWHIRQKSTEWEERSTLLEQYRAETLAKQQLTEEQREEFRQMEQSLGNEWRWGGALTRYTRLQKLIPKLSLLRVLLDLLLPFVLGCFGLYVVIAQIAHTKAPPPPIPSFGASEQTYRQPAALPTSHAH